MSKDRVYRAIDRDGNIYRVQSPVEYKYALIVHPAPIDSIYRRPCADWYVSEAQANRHGLDWFQKGYPVEIVPAEPLEPGEPCCPTILALPKYHMEENTHADT